MNTSASRARLAASFAFAASYTHSKLVKDAHRPLPDRQVTNLSSISLSYSTYDRQPAWDAILAVCTSKRFEAQLNLDQPHLCILLALHDQSAQGVRGDVSGPAAPCIAPGHEPQLVL